MYGKKEGLNTMRGYRESSNTCCSMAKRHTGTSRMQGRLTILPACNVTGNLIGLPTSTCGAVALAQERQDQAGCKRRAQIDVLGIAKKFGRSMWSSFSAMDHLKVEYRKKGEVKKTRLERIAERVALLLSCIQLHSCIQMRWLNTGREVEKRSEVR